MKKGVIIGLVVAVILIIAVVVILILVGNRETPLSQLNSNEMIDCGMMDNPSCMLNRMTQCLPVTGTLIATDGVTPIQLTIVGVENDKCHYQRKVNGVINQECFFPIDAMSWDLIDQTFGNDKGLQQIVDQSCQ